MMSFVRLPLWQSPDFLAFQKAIPYAGSINVNLIVHTEKGLF
jgi:hypothetical protein